MASKSCDHIVKLALLGASTAGKSLLLRRFCDSVSDTDDLVTIGVDFKKRDLERRGKKLRIEVWDTRGQERFLTILPAYYRSVMGWVITYDITDQASFDLVENWLQQIEALGAKDVQRILVGNKSDLEDLRKIPRKDGEALASRFNMAFFEISAKSGANVEDALLKITDEVVAQKYKGADARRASKSGAMMKFQGQRKNCACVVC